jgi:predicted GIY-YIG superfamily endonuclease
MWQMHEHFYFTYLMASRSRNLYIGVTRDLLRRVFQRKWKEREGFTARYNCDRLVVRAASVCPGCDSAREATEGLGPFEENRTHRNDKPGLGGFES